MTPMCLSSSDARDRFEAVHMTCKPKSAHCCDIRWEANAQVYTCPPAASTATKHAACRTMQTLLLGRRCHTLLLQRKQYNQCQSPMLPRWSAVRADLRELCRRLCSIIQPALSQGCHTVMSQANFSPKQADVMHKSNTATSAVIRC
jgi:hypothetical protein